MFRYPPSWERPIHATATSARSPHHSAGCSRPATAGPTPIRSTAGDAGRDSSPPALLATSASSSRGAQASSRSGQNASAVGPSSGLPARTEKTWKPNHPSVVRSRAATAPAMTSAETLPAASPARRDRGWRQSPNTRPTSGPRDVCLASTAAAPRIPARAPAAPCPASARPEVPTSSAAAIRARDSASTRAMSSQVPVQPSAATKTPALSSPPKRPARLRPARTRQTRTASVESTETERRAGRSPSGPPAASAPSQWNSGG